MDSAVAVIDKHRLAGLQDGVYSIAMTLLVLELKLPAAPEHLSDAILWSLLVSIWPKLLTWLLSFWVLVIFWIGDVRALSAFNAVDSFLLRLSLLRMALVSLLPFSTALMGEYGIHFAGAAVYSGHLVLLSGTQVARHAYVCRHTVFVTWASPQAAVELGHQSWATLVCAIAAFALAFVAPAYNMFALLPLVFLRVLRRFQPGQRTTKNTASQETTPGN